MKLDYRNSAEIIANTPEAYEKLILDCLNGAMVPNFTHWHEVAQSWKIVDQIVKLGMPIPLLLFQTYAAGTMGPDEAFTYFKKMI